MGSYFGGTIIYDVAKSDAVLDALNLALRREAPIIVGHSEGFGEGSLVLPFAFKSKDENSLFESSKGMSLAEFKKCFAGCDLRIGELSPSVDNREQLRLANELENATPSRIRKADIAPIASDRDPSEDPFASFVGLEKQIGMVKEALAAASLYGRDSLCLNMVFAGGPGSGKSSFAAAVGEYAKSLGIINGRVCQYSAEQLVARYAGQTAHAVAKAWEVARGGIFFLDEAYRLTDTSSYGIEAINALNELMERDRDEVMVIAAGYPLQMDAFLGANPGLAGRFGFAIEFPDYGVDEMAGIFTSFAKGRKVKMSPDAQGALSSSCRAMKRARGFANARSVRRLFERCLIKQMLLGGGDVITAEALRLAMSEDDLATPECKMGFAP